MASIPIVQFSVVRIAIGADHAGFPLKQHLKETLERMGHSVDDHGGWAYTTVLARPARPIDAAELRLDGESDGAAWLPLVDLHEVELHPGLAASLSRLLPLLKQSGH